MEKDDAIGYLINIGITSCRLFKVLSDSSLEEEVVTSYSISDPGIDGYLDGIIDHIHDAVLPYIDNKQVLLRVFVDAEFSEIFNSPSEEKDFILKFYKQTKLYFNILTKEQTKENLSRLFGRDISDTGIVDIGSRSIIILKINSDGGEMIHRLPIHLSLVNKQLERLNATECWTEEQILSTKKYIKDYLYELSNTIKELKADNVIIIKDELDFMKNNGYRLIETPEGMPNISFEDYKKFNRSNLFTIDFLSNLREKYTDDAEIKRYHGFKTGHLILEAIFELLEVKRIYPSNQHSIHGSINAYASKVVLSSSADKKGIKYLVEANEIMQKLGVEVLSPSFRDNNLKNIATGPDYLHLKAIDACDVLLVCNKDSNVGETTKYEIYYAYAIKKTIAFWKEPDPKECFSFIPHEHWERLLD